MAFECEKKNAVYKCKELSLICACADCAKNFPGNL